MSDTMYDLAEPDMNEGTAVPSEGPSKPREPYYQSVSFDVKQIPDLKDAQIGDKVTLLVECQVCGIDAGEKRHSVRLKMKNGAVDIEPTNKSDKSKKVSDLFKSDKKSEDDEDYSEDIVRAPGQETKANKFGKQLNS